jgi:hypothetical protein
MILRRVSWSLVLVAGVIGVTAISEAAPPWSRVFTRSKIEANPDEAYPLTEDHGPWMIMATTFSGDGAEEQARELVHELRSRYKLRAYTYQKRFDFSQGAEGRGFDRYGAPLKMRYQRGDAMTEIAVVVGDFPSADDGEAQKALRKLKFAQPEALKVEGQEKTNQTLAGFRSMQAQVYQAVLPDSDERKFRGPMGHAFITTNPLLPPEYFVPKGIDKLVLDMNKGIKHSLLDCPGKYTVQVATFTGQVVIDQKKIQEIESGKNYKSKLDTAAEDAHKLCTILRKEGVEAYEFHDRYQSIVTVGSFNSVGTPRQDGKIEINPAIYKIIQTYGAETKMVPGQAQPMVGNPKSRGKILFDISPIPVEVPRRSISADYQRTALN